jgi:hypothetical protein
MESILILTFVIALIAILLILVFLHIKKKIKYKIISEATKAVKKGANKYLDKDTADKVCKGTDFAADTIKDGKSGLIKKGLKLAKERR